MQFIFSTESKWQINLLYGNRSYYLTNHTFCPSFVDFLGKMSLDFDRLLSGNVTYTIKKGFRYTELSALAITYRIINIGIIEIDDIAFIGLGKLKKLCSYDRRVAGVKMGKRPNQTKCGLPSDYIQSNLNGGQINGVPVLIVQRKGIKRKSPFFNYLFNGKLLSKYDVLNPTPFVVQKDGELKAYADAGNGKRYWLYPTGKWRLIKESKLKKNIIIENNATNKIRNMNNKKVVRLTESQLHNIIAESVSQILNEIGDTEYGQYMMGRLSRRQYDSGLTDAAKETSAYAMEQPWGARAAYNGRGQRVGDYENSEAFERGDIHQMQLQNRIKDGKMVQAKDYADKIKNTASNYYNQSPMGQKRKEVEAIQNAKSNRQNFSMNQFK